MKQIVPSKRIRSRAFLSGSRVFAYELRCILAAGVCFAWATAAVTAPVSELRGGELKKGAVFTPLAPAADGSFVLVGAGHESNNGTDEAAFAGFETEALNFTFVARVAKVENPGSIPKIGITARAGIEGAEKAVHLRYDGYSGHQCLQWFVRSLMAPGNPDGGQRAYLSGVDKDKTRLEGVWLKLVRKYPYVTFFSSDDGQDWREVGAGQSKILLPQKVWVGLQVTAGDIKSPPKVTFDKVSFAAGADNDSADTPDTYKEWAGKVKTHIFYCATVTDQKGLDPRTIFALVPKGAAIKKFRAILWSVGSKNLAANGTAYKFRSGEGWIRVPESLAKNEGAVEIDGLDPFYAMLEYEGLIRVGGYFPPERYAAGIKRLAEISKIPELANMPFLATGMSFAGGWTAGAAKLYSDKTIAASPVCLGMVAAETEDPGLLSIPMLHIYGSKDGPHLKDALHWTSLLRAKHALWANAPMWTLEHRQFKADALINPYFLDALALRVPATHDYAKGPVMLTKLREEDGWFGDIDTWNTNDPKVGAVTGRDSKNCVWLPTERSARAWQAFVSFNPLTTIHFPAFDGTAPFGGTQPYDWRISTMEAGKPWELMASGPLGEGLKVKYFADTKELKVLKTIDNNPYRVTLEPLESGLHVIYAITTLAGAREISHPVSIFFHP